MADARAALDGLVEVCNDLAAWLAGCANVVGQPAEVAADLAEWHARLIAQLADAAEALTPTVDVVTCADCSRPVPVSEYHDGADGDRVCETCCPRCQTNGVPAGVPGPLEVLPCR